MRDRQSVLNLQNLNGDCEGRRYMAEPFIPFKVLGLLALGVDETSRLIDLHVGQSSLGVAPLDVPLELFVPRRAQSFAELAKLAEKNELATELQPFQRFESGIVTPGQKILATTLGPVRELVVWGLNLGNRIPTLTCNIVAKRDAQRASQLTYVGTLTVTDLEGSYEDLSVAAPTAEAVATVLAARAGSDPSTRRGWYR